jgi:hypothetical protein
MIGVRNIIIKREGELMAKKVRVNAYTKPSTGQNVRGYVREDPRASSKGAPHELPPENDKPSFLSDGIESDEDKKADNESEEGKGGD